MDVLRQDIGYGLRALGKNPAVTITALLTLAVGIGATTAIFSVIDAVMLKPLPYPHSDRIVSIWEKRPTGQASSMSVLNYLDYANQNTVFERIAATINCCSAMRLTDVPVPVMLGPERVSPAYFDILGIAPFLGRTFLPGEDTPGRDHMVVLSHRVWAAQFGADRAIIGHIVHLDGEAYTVIGVMPPGNPFDHMYPNVWIPLTFTAENTSRSSHWLTSGTGAALGLLKPGATIEQARAEIEGIAARIAAAHPETNKGWGAFVDLYESVAAGKDVRQSLYLLFGAVGLVLLIGCVNLANIMLARGLARQREMSLRLALGASPVRLVRQLLTESVLLSLAGGALGLAAGLATTRALISALAALPLAPGVLPSGVPPEAAAGLDVRVLFFSLIVSVTCGIAFGLAPALGVVRAGRTRTLGYGERAGTDRTHSRLRGSLVVAEIALACVLFTSAGVLIRSFINMRQADAGLDGTNVVTASMPFPQHHFASAAAFLSYLHAVNDKLMALPGVQDVAFTNGLPFQGVCCGAFFQIVGRPYQLRAQRPIADWKIVTPPYFHVMSMRLLRGRTLSALDTSGAPGAMVINETMASTYFANEQPIGQHVLLDTATFGTMTATGEKPYAVVGVVADEQMTSFDDKRARPVIYVSNEQEPSDDVSSIVIRAAADPSHMGNSIRAAVAAVDKNQPVTEIKTVGDVRSASMTADRLRSLLLLLFAAVALLLAAVGIYGVTSYSVGQRQHEMGIRAALGATPSSLIRLVVGGGVRLTAAGLGVGCFAALGATRLLRAFLFGVGAMDGVALATTVVILAAVSVLACYVPARAAARSNPLDALRE